MTPPDTSDDTRVGSALIIALVGLLVPAGLAVFFTLQGWESSDIMGVVGLFTALIGTMVGAFLGVQIGAAGKKETENMAKRVLAALPPDTDNNPKKP